MKCNDRIDLTARERATVAAILSVARNEIGQVKVFGSRAGGKARPGSDLDLVVFPPSPTSALHRLFEAFEDSDLPITVDVVAWDEISHAPLRDEIRRSAVPFFDEASA